MIIVKKKITKMMSSGTETWCADGYFLHRQFFECRQLGVICYNHISEYYLTMQVQFIEIYLREISKNHRKFKILIIKLFLSNTFERDRTI